MGPRLDLVPGWRAATHARRISDPSGKSMTVPQLWRAPSDRRWSPCATGRPTGPATASTNATSGAWRWRTGWRLSGPSWSPEPGTGSPCRAVCRTRSEGSGRARRGSRSCIDNASFRDLVRNLGTPATARTVPNQPAIPPMDELAPTAASHDLRTIGPPMSIGDGVWRMHPGGGLKGAVHRSWPRKHARSTPAYPSAPHHSACLPPSPFQAGRDGGTGDESRPAVEAPAVTLQSADDVSHLHEFRARDRCDDLLEPSPSRGDRRSRTSRRGRLRRAKFWSSS